MCHSAPTGSNAGAAVLQAHAQESPLLAAHRRGGVHLWRAGSRVSLTLPQPPAPQTGPLQRARHRWALRVRRCVCAVRGRLLCVLGAKSVGGRQAASCTDTWHCRHLHLCVRPRRAAGAPFCGALSERPVMLRSSCCGTAQALHAAPPEVLATHPVLAHGQQHMRI